VKGALGSSSGPRAGFIYARKSYYHGASAIIYYYIVQSSQEMRCHKLSQNEGLYIIYHRPSQVIGLDGSSFVGQIYLYI
jgi:hypothetical protein